MEILENINTYKKQLQKVKDIYVTRGYYLNFIHYSCESFEKDSPRITCISINNLESGQTKSFSFGHYKAILKTEDLDLIERKLLDEYYAYLKENSHYFWIHWNMKNATYGFQAIDNRYEILGGVPVIIDDDMKVELLKLLYDIYGDDFIQHGEFYSLLRKNKISEVNMLTGLEEYVAFEKGEYSSVHKSCQSKVEAIEAIFVYLAKGRLKTDRFLWQIYGFSPQGIIDMLNDHWIGWIITLLIGAALGTLFS